MNRKILAVAWFEHSGHKIGIIIVQEIDDVKAGYIGVCAGIDEKKDCINIAKYGKIFELDAARRAINTHGRYLIAQIEIPEK